MRYIGERDSAQEVLQVSFLKVFDKLEHFDFSGSLEGWIRRIVSNTAIDHLRKAKKDPFLSDQDNDFKSMAADPMQEQELLEHTQLKAEVAQKAIEKPLVDKPATQYEPPLITNHHTQQIYTTQ